MSSGVELVVPVLLRVGMTTPGKSVMCIRVRALIIHNITLTRWSLVAEIRHVGSQVNLHDGAGLELRTSRLR